MSLWKADDGLAARRRLLLQTKLGDTAIALILIGTAARVASFAPPGSYRTQDGWRGIPHRVRREPQPAASHASKAYSA
jgi:hypothetical protein